jgi:peroxin-5
VPNIIDWWFFFSKLQADDICRLPPFAFSSSAWREQFQQQGPASASVSSAPSHQNGSANYAPRMGGGGGMYSGGMMGYGGMSGMGMSGSYANQMSQSSQRNQSGATASSDKGKSRFVELDDASWEAQFKALDEAQNAATQDKGKAKAQDPILGEEDQDAAVRNALDGVQSDITAEGREADARFQELWNAMQNSTAGDRAEVDEDLAKWEEELNRQSDGVGYRHPGGGIAGGDGGVTETAGWDGTEDHLLDGYGTIGPDGYPRLGTYRRSTQNPFMQHQDPLSEGLRLLSSGGSLTDATLAFEAATIKPQTGGTGGEAGEVDRERRSRSEAWRKLGEAQAMNERESQAIRALEEAIRVDEGNLEAYMALAISYINEGYDLAAHSTLQRYINRAYPHLKADIPEILQTSSDPLEPGSSTNPWATLNAVTSLFLAAARENASRGMVDPEVQVGLGVLFYADSSYEKAEDCFRSALEVRPNDFLLWNRLGATLANGGKPEEAIEAYHKALESRPTFTRAIYNLSVSCLNLGAHHEAAEHLLSALSLQQTQQLPDVPPGEAPPTAPLAEAQESHGLWSTLRRICE